jgi:hypothetical protein
MSSFWAKNFFSWTESPNQQLMFHQILNPSSTLLLYTFYALVRSSVCESTLQFLDWWLFVCVHACKQFFVLLIIISLWFCKFCSMALGYAYPAYECFKIVERNRPNLEELRFWCQYWYPPSTHACTFIPLIPTYSFSCLSFGCCNRTGR